MTREKQKPSKLFDKIWDNYLVCQEPLARAVLYIHLHLIHEVTSPAAFEVLRHPNLAVHRPDRTFATADHNVPTVNQH